MSAIESIEHNPKCGTSSPIIGADSVERRFHLQVRLNGGKNEYRAVCQCGAHSAAFTDLTANWPSALVPSGIKYEPTIE